MAEIKEEFKKLEGMKEYVILATVKAKDYQETNLKLIKHLTSEESIPGVYVTLSKPFETMQKIFRRKGIDTDMVLFIDAVTDTSDKEIKKTKECLYIGGPEKLSDVSIAMDQAVRALPSKEKFVFFDSLSVLLMYNQVETVAKFIHFLASKMRTWKVKGIIISLQKNKDKELIDELSQFCDSTFDLGGK
jgi:KaiC/GvpD/RAD55 family RecA-like ATPase